MYDVCQKNDCCSIIYCLKNALGELLDSKKIKKKELVGEDIVNCLNKIIEEDKYLQYISLGLPAIISNNQVIESDIDSLKEILLMNDIKCIAYGYNQMHHQNVYFLTFPKDSGHGAKSHYLYNHGNSPAKILWITTPPIF